MPELPEVETISSELNEVLFGKKIRRIEIFNKKSFLGEVKNVLNKKIKRVRRRSKMIIIDFEKSNFKILIHLKMTGQLVWRDKPLRRNLVGRQVAGGHPTSDWLNKLPSKHTRIIFKLSGESCLFFNDLRKFGWVKVLDEDALKVILKKMPPDVIDFKFDENYFKEVLSRSGRAIKVLIMDQTKMGGVGNIYACDGLFEAKINPLKKSKDLKRGEIKKLFKAIRKVVKLGIKHKGATYSSFVSSRGVGGKYQEYFLVYDRQGQTCHDCKALIQKVKVGGRGTYFCPKCQA
jgi:formamidopyrimidine-DNA glycosylase